MHHFELSASKNFTKKGKLKYFAFLEIFCQQFQPKSFYNFVSFFINLNKTLSKLNQFRQLAVLVFLDRKNAKK